MYHEPALLRETTEGLAIRSGGTYLDGTVGGGGHLLAICDRLGPDGTVVGIDRDPQALAWVRAHAPAGGPRLVLAQARFSEFGDVLRREGIDALDGALLDLGVSSHQLDSAERGFSYLHDGPLDMRMDPGAGRSAAQLLRESDVTTLTQVLSEYGELRSAPRMARALWSAAQKGTLDTTADLRRCLEAEFGRLQPSVLSQVFQALRIAVNGELDELRLFLQRIPPYLRAGARLAVISYHSLEDRLVKNAIRDRSGRCICPPGLPVCRCGMHREFKRVTAKAVRPSAAEIAANRRARSARLRIAERVA